MSARKDRVKAGTIALTPELVSKLQGPSSDCGPGPNETLCNDADYARRHGAAKRGGDVCKVTLQDAMVTPNTTDVDIVALDDALRELAKIDERQSRVVELRFFAGLSLEEISQALDVAPATVQRDWTAARAWLHRELSKKSSS